MPTKTRRDAAGQGSVIDPLTPDDILNGHNDVHAARNNISTATPSSGNGNHVARSSASMPATTLATTAAQNQHTREPVFEMIVLGCGGGPLETDCSGYIVKPYRSQWEDGVLALEGGSGIGALARHLERYPAEQLFPNVEFPEDYGTPVLKAAYIFSYLSCYLITHAHLDHVVSLIVLSGSVPPRDQTACKSKAEQKNTDASPLPSRIPVYATRDTLKNLQQAYAGGLWPELANWESDSDLAQEVNSNGVRKRRRIRRPSESGAGAKFSPIEPSTNNIHAQLHPSLPITQLVFPVSHGRTTSGPYGSSAFFLRYDPSVLESAPPSRAASQTSALSSKRNSFQANSPPPLGDGDPMEPMGREFLFFGDVESRWRPESQQDWGIEAGKYADEMNVKVWEQAATSVRQGRLAGIFIECSYDSSRSADIMFGHMSPPGIFYELQALADMLPPGPRPLAGVTLYITHIKELLRPHPSGKAGRDLIYEELLKLEAKHQFGIEICVPRPGDRLLI